MELSGLCHKNILESFCRICKAQEFGRIGFVNPCGEWMGMPGIAVCPSRQI